MKDKVNIVRHGDLAIKRIKRMPKGNRKNKENSFVLAEGEHTGHKHVITVEPEALLKIVEKEGTLYIETTGQATVKHEEHKTITLDPGKWQVVHEREFDYFALEIIKVQD